MKSVKTVMTSEEAMRLIEKAAADGKHEISFEGVTFEDFDLSDKVIPVSLSCQKAVFNGVVRLCRSKFLANFIDLESATLRQGIVLNGLESERGYSLYLRKAKVHGKISLQDTNLHWLCFEGIRHSPGKDDGRVGQIYLQGTTISHGIAFREERF